MRVVFWEVGVLEVCVVSGDAEFAGVCVRDFIADGGELSLFELADDFKGGEASVMRVGRVLAFDFAGNDVEVVIGPHLRFINYYNL